MFPAGVKKEALYSRNIGDSRFERRHTMKHAWKKLLAAAVLPQAVSAIAAASSRAVILVIFMFLTSF